VEPAASGGQEFFRIDVCRANAKPSVYDFGTISR
jgi:hypothetical protein